MKAISLLYHDVVDRDDWDSSGFPGPEAAKYKLPRQEFKAHLAAAAQAHVAGAITVQDVLRGTSSAIPMLITFDDGGSSAVHPVADLLENLDWRGHFFITTGQIGKRGFMTPAQIRDLHERGHVVGSHSYSHPTRMSHCDDKKLAEEWTRSVEMLSDLLGEKIGIASVPGGYYSRRVAQSAAAAGVQILFNSEPTTRITRVSGCFVLGRYTVVRGMPARLSGRLASADGAARSRQWIFWNLKKTAKAVGGKHYLIARRYLLRR
jgi:peptidoglycan/xylan/chitin deacetylase (PgdA/CDA1 family)